MIIGLAQQIDEKKLTRIWFIKSLIPSRHLYFTQWVTLKKLYNYILFAKKGFLIMFYEFYKSSCQSIRVLNELCSHLLWLVHLGWALCRRGCSPRIYTRRYERPVDRPRPETAGAPGYHFWALSARPTHRWPDARPRWTSRCSAADFRRPCNPTRRRWNSRIRSSTAVPPRN